MGCSWRPGAFVVSCTLLALTSGCGFHAAPDGGDVPDLGPLVCRGERYDVDGRDDTGCEAEDLPLQDSPTVAVAINLPDLVDSTRGNPRNYAGHIYGDSRLHDGDLQERPNGRDDWFAVTAVGPGDPHQKMGACLSISSFPRDNQFQVCITEAGQSSFGTNQCAVVTGDAGGSVCVRPASQPDFGGPFYVRVRKLAGTNALLDYALYLSH
jgi:hypothetical protein